MPKYMFLTIIIESWEIITEKYYTVTLESPQN